MAETETIEQRATEEIAMAKAAYTDPSPPNGPWDADTLTEGKIWSLTQAAVLLYCDCEQAPLARAALELAEVDMGARARLVADDVFWAHLPSEWLRSWEKLQAWFDDEDWPVPYPRPATCVQD